MEPRPAAGFVDLGADVTAVALDSAGKTLYAATKMDLVVIDAGSGTITRRIPTNGRSIAALAFSRDGRHLYLADFARASETRSTCVLDYDVAGSRMASCIPDGVNPRWLAINPKNGRVFAIGNGVAVIDPTTSTVGGKHKLSSTGASVFSPDGSVLYLTSYGTNAVTIVDTSSMQTVGDPVPTGHGPVDLVMSPDGSRIYVADQGGGVAPETVTVIDTKERRAVATFSDGLDGDLSAIAVSPDGATVYVGASLVHSVWAIDAKTGRASDTVFAVDAGVTDLAVAQDNRTVFVAAGLGVRKVSFH